MRRKRGTTKQHFPKVLEAFRKVLQKNTGFPVGLISLEGFIEVRAGNIWTPSKQSATGHPVQAPHVASCSCDTLWLTLLTPFWRQRSETQSHRKACTQQTMVSRFKPSLKPSIRHKATLIKLGFMAVMVADGCICSRRTQESSCDLGTGERKCMDQ